MRILTYRTDEGLALGIKGENGVIDVAAAATALEIAVPGCPACFYTAGLDAMDAISELVGRADTADAAWMLNESGLRFGPCVVSPEKILCVGLNYRRHAAESGAAVPDVPVLFSKLNNALAAHGEDIPLPHTAVGYDYEVELAVVMGRTASNVSKEDALDYVLGYTNANDVSARDLQKRTSQWLLGKTLDKFCPIGPYLVTSDEVPNPQALTARSWLNGELRQNSNTADQIFPVAEVIAYVTQYLPLKPGDIILTGTPEGVILGMEEKIWMKPGDVVDIEVGDFGKLTNTLA